MTVQEFKSRAKTLGLNDLQIDCQVKLYDKFLRMGMEPIPFETALAAVKKKSCVEVFEANCGK